MNAITVNGSTVLGGVVYAPNGTKSTFGCVVSGTSSLRTSWSLQTKGGEMNRSDSNFSSTLSENDEGNYTCSVVYEIGCLNDSATIIVKVFGKHINSNSLLPLAHHIILSLGCM